MMLLNILKHVDVLLLLPIGFEIAMNIMGTGGDECKASLAGQLSSTRSMLARISQDEKLL